MASIRLQKVGTNALIFIHVAFCFCSILLFNVLSGFVSSTKYISEYMKINAGASFAFLAGVLLVTTYLRRFALNLRESTILKGLCISVGLWIVMITVTTVSGMLEIPTALENVVFSPLYAVISFDELMAKIFSIDMGKSVTSTNAVVCIAYVFVYQLCYAIVPTIIIAVLHAFTKQQKLTSKSRDR